MTRKDQNSLEFFDEIKKEWCISEEQWKPFWNDVLTFARKYHKERIEYSKKRKKMKEPKRYSCGNGEGMFEYDKNCHWVEYSEHKAIVEALTEQLRKHDANNCYTLQDMICAYDAGVWNPNDETAKEYMKRVYNVY